MPAMYGAILYKVMNTCKLYLILLLLPLLCNSCDDNEHPHTEWDFNDQ